MGKYKEPDAELLPSIERFIEKYVALPSKDHARVLSLYVLHTHLFDGIAYITPYIYITASGPGAGKTTLLKTLYALVRNPKLISDSTTPALSKMIDARHPTLLFDEFDAKRRGNVQLRTILNAGNEEDGVVSRQEYYEEREMSVFCPKILCGIQNGWMHETTRDRSIVIELQRMTSSQRVDRFSRMSRVKQTPEFREAMGRIERFVREFKWEVKATQDILEDDLQPILSLSPRQNQIVEPLIAIAAVLGQENSFRRSLENVFASSSGKVQLSTEAHVFGKIRAAFDGRARISSDELAQAIGPHYTPRRLALWLDRFGIKPIMLRVDSQPARGYTVDQFAEVFEQYLGIKHLEFDEDPWADEPEAEAIIDNEEMEVR